jgi:hypothetical protein
MIPPLRPSDEGSHRKTLAPVPSPRIGCASSAVRSPHQESCGPDGASEWFG